MTGDGVQADRSPLLRALRVLLRPRAQERALLGPSPQRPPPRRLRDLPLLAPRPAFRAAASWTVLLQVSLHLPVIHPSLSLRLARRRAKVGAMAVVAAVAVVVVAVAAVPIPPKILSSWRVHPCTEVCGIALTT